MKQENTYPKYYYCEADNKIIKLIDEKTLVYYQIKKYESGEIRHSYGKTSVPSPERMEKALEKYTVSTEERFRKVVSSYYQKEKENAEKVRKQLFNE